MREILFRGKRVDNGEWVEGSLIHQTKFYGDPVDHYHILYDGEFHIDYYGSAEVIPETVGQFTGLLDKNGKKIFEGDVLAVGYTGMVRSVVFNDNAEFEFDDRDTVLNVDGLCLCCDHADCEIVSNIHDGKTYMVPKK